MLRCQGSILLLGHFYGGPYESSRGGQTGLQDGNSLRQYLNVVRRFHKRHGTATRPMVKKIA